MSIPVPPQLCYLAEWYQTELTEDHLDHIAARIEDCAASMSAEGSQVRLLMTLAVPADDVVFGVFAASSAHIVGQTCSRAGFSAQRLTPALDARIPDKY